MSVYIVKNSFLLLKNILLSLFLQAGAIIINKSSTKDRKASEPCEDSAVLPVSFAKTGTEEKRRNTIINNVKPMLFAIIFILKFFMYLLQPITSTFHNK